MEEFSIMYDRVMQKFADKKGMTLEEYKEFGGICYQHTQGYYSNKKEEKYLLDRYWSLINLGKKRLDEQ